MKVKLFLLLIIIPGIAVSQPGFDPDPMVDVERYQFSIALSDTSDIISCSALIGINLRGTVSSLNLDLDKFSTDGKGMKVSSVSFNGKDTDWEHSFDKILIRPGNQFSSVTSGEIRVIYSGVPADGLIISKNKFGRRTFFADHWPDRASKYLPVVDHPSDKAKVEFIITAPSHYEVVASGIMIEESDLPGDMKITHWCEDIPLPVKVMTFGAADFAVQLAGRVGNVPVWTWVFPENREAGFHDYAVAVKPLEFYSELIGPYPYEKLANVQSRTIFGGLENAGCIFYSENSVTGEGRAESLIAHEIAHQWFGNSVTEKNWHHIWLSEGFATYLTSVYDEMTYGSEKLSESMMNNRLRILRSFERTPRPVVDTTVTNLMRLLNTNSYQKGAWVLHMLRSELGDEKFWKGIRLYYSRFRNGNALTRDFRKTMEEAGGRDLEKFFHQWLYVPGQPDLRVTYKPSVKKGTADLLIEQTQEYLFIFNIGILFKDTEGNHRITVAVSERETTVKVKASPDAEMIIDPEVKLLFRQVR